MRIFDVCGDTFNVRDAILARIGTRELPAGSYSETHALFPLHLHHVGDGHRGLAIRPTYFVLGPRVSYFVDSWVFVSSAVSV